MTIREGVLAIAAVALAMWVIGLQYENHNLQSQLDKINQAVQEEQVRYAKQLSEATNSIVAASNEYDAVKRERDSLVDRLRRATSGSGKADSAGACEARAARLENMVDGLLDLVERCDAGWHGCAARKDALSEVIK